MKLQIDRAPVKEPGVQEDTSSLHLPLGIVGFPQLTEAEIVFVEEELPFMRLHSKGEEAIHFLVINPVGILPDYQVELMDADAEYLDIQSSDDVLLLNIAKVNSSSPLKITLNLIGPIVVNRKTRKAKQVVIANHADYTTRHSLFEEPVVAS